MFFRDYLEIVKGIVSQKIPLLSVCPVVLTGGLATLTECTFNYPLLKSNSYQLSSSWGKTSLWNLGCASAYRIDVTDINRYPRWSKFLLFREQVYNCEDDIFFVRIEKMLKRFKLLCFILKQWSKGKFFSRHCPCKPFWCVFLGKYPTPFNLFKTIIHDLKQQFQACHSV